MIGVNLQLFDVATSQDSLTGIQALWWDVTEPKDFSTPIGRSEIVTTDASGYINLDLSNVTGLSIGDYGFLTLYKLDAGDDEDSLVFSGKVITSNIGSGVDMYYYDPQWTRPTDWPALDAPVVGTQKIQLLYAVHDIETAGNAVAFSAAAAYSVDWGDGTASEDVATGVTAEHTFDYDDADFADSVIKGQSDAVAVTFTASTDMVNRTAHGYSANQVLNLATLVTTTGISTFTKYFVKTGTADTFQLSLTAGGAAITLTSDGSGTVFIPEYKSCIVTITPQAANNITAFNLRVLHSNFSNECNVPWLDVTINGEFLATLTIGGTSTLRTTSIEQVTIGEHNKTNYENVFRECYNLQSVPLFDTSSVVRVAGMFADCKRLKAIPLFDTSSVTGALGVSNMFSGCFSLETVPLLDLSGVTSMITMFTRCTSLTTLPLFDTSSVTNMDNTFSSCESLKSLPLFDTGLVTIASHMCQACYSLETVPCFDFSSLVTSGITYAFNDCYCLKKIPLFDLSGVTSLSNAFRDCKSLLEVPLIDTSSVTDMGYCFNGCDSLLIVASLDLSSVTVASATFGSLAPSLQSSPFQGLAVDFSFTNCNLGPEALDAIYTGLATATKTITVTGNWGVSGDDPTIATAKNWTVTG